MKTTSPLSAMVNLLPTIIDAVKYEDTKNIKQTIKDVHTRISPSVPFTAVEKAVDKAVELLVPHYVEY